MAVDYGTGAKGRATGLHSLIVRARGACQRCGRRCACPDRPRSHVAGCPLRCVHIVSRSVNQTRTRLDNAVCLCVTCQAYFKRCPAMFGEFVDEVIGREARLRLHAVASAKGSVRWSEELDRLTGIAEQIGIV